eukprot:scaffold5742_cov95-Isochrysis_galbana.AAC.4
MHALKGGEVYSVRGEKNMRFRGGSICASGGGGVCALQVQTPDVSMRMAGGRGVYDDNDNAAWRVNEGTP